MKANWCVPFRRRSPNRRFRIRAWPFIPPHLAGRLVNWGKHARRPFPWRQATDPFHLLLAEMLLRQTSAQQVADVFPTLVDRFPTPAQLAAADRGELYQMLQPLGLAAQRSEALPAMARALLADWGGQVPCRPDQLRQLPHVGPYTANAVASFGFGIPVPVVDANVIRVMDRFTGRKTKGPNPHRAPALWRRTYQSLPVEEAVAFNYALLDLGALLCRPRPDCRGCPLVRGCAHGLHS